MHRIIYSFIFVLTLICTGLLFSANSAKAQPSPGCDDAQCEAAVCEVDPFCCDVTWDGICQNEAFSLCGNLCTGCPTGKGAEWHVGLVTTCKAFMDPDGPYDDVGNCNDKNEDGWLCFRLVPGLLPEDSPHPIGWTWHDNNKKVKSNCCPQPNG